MSALVYAVVFCIVAVLVYMARYSGRLRVSERRTIDAPLAAVHAQVADLRRWREWSPWLAQGGDAGAASTTSREDGTGSCTWERGGVAAGRIENLGAPLDGARIEQRLRLWKPLPFSGRSSWQFSEDRGRTQATWSLRGRVGFSMRAFAPTVQGSIALDFRYGLDRLAARVEPEHAPRYAVSFDGVREVAALRYAWIAHEGPIAELGAAIEGVVAELRRALARRGVEATGAPIGVYVKTDIKRRTTLCRLGLPIGAAEVEGLAVATLPAHRAFIARLRGSRSKLEIAWYLAMQRLGADGLQPDLRIAPFERYVGATEGGTGADAVTELHLPLR
jgi:hypothetical protein